MRVVADITVFRYLVIIGAIDLLLALFAQVVVPPAVVAELRHLSAPAPVRAWIETPPPWVVIQPPRLPPDPTLRHLGAGEHEALLLIYDRQGTVLLTDDRDAYRAARERESPVLRTLRVLEMGAERAT